MGLGALLFSWLESKQNNIDNQKHNSFFISYGVEVHGIDLATNMIAIANDYRAEMEPSVKHRVQFYVEDATTMDYPLNFYDVVYRLGI